MSTVLDFSIRHVFLQTTFELAAAFPVQENESFGLSTNK
jgi:hypothetical protein